MPKFLRAGLVYILANGLGLLLAVVLLTGFRIDFWSVLLVVLVFSAVQAILTPILSRLSSAHAPQLAGSLSLVTVFLGLFVTDLMMTGMQVGGVSNWLAATLLIWVGSLLASIVLPTYVFPKPEEARK